jgi:hypothetical protein
LTHFSRELTEEEKLYGYIVQEYAAAHRANFSLAAIQDEFGEQLITHGLWSTDKIMNIYHPA